MDDDRLSVPVLVVVLMAVLAAASCNARSKDESKAGGKTEVTLATVANPQMEDMAKLAKVFEKDNPTITVNFVVLPENQLRDRITQDVATKGGQFDIVTVGTYEVPIWAKNGWIEPLSDRIAATSGYDGDDIIPAVREALSYEGKVHAVPFYAESSFLMYRKDLFDAAGLTMPDHPTWDQVADFAAKLHHPDQKQYGICLRGLPGWGEVFAPLNTVVNTFGGRWYDEQWNAKLTEQPFVDAVTFYVNLVRNSGQPGAAKSGFTECLTATAQGNAAMWYDATVAASLLEDPKSSKVAGKMAYVPAPVKETKAAGWLWAWSLAIPKTSRKQDAAWKFVAWATSKEYMKLVGQTLGWTRVPPGSRVSTYSIPEYKEAAKAFASITLQALEEIDPKNPGTQPRPYAGIQYVGIPEFQALGTSVSQEIAAAIAGSETPDEALAKGQVMAEEVASKGGYKK